MHADTFFQPCDEYCANELCQARQDTNTVVLRAQNVRQDIRTWG